MVQPAVGRSLEVDDGAERDDAGRVDGGVALIIVTLDVGEIDRVLDAGCLIELARVGPEVRVIDEPADVAFEVADIDHIEAQERGEQAPVRLGLTIATEEAPGRQMIFQPIQGLEQRADGFFVGGLSGREPRFVYAVVHPVVDSLV